VRIVKVVLRMKSVVCSQSRRQAQTCNLRSLFGGSCGQPNCSCSQHQTHLLFTVLYERERERETENKRLHDKRENRLICTSDGIGFGSFDEIIEIVRFRLVYLKRLEWN
jgi:hypothetical protein